MHFFWGGGRKVYPMQNIGMSFASMSVCAAEAERPLHANANKREAIPMTARGLRGSGQPGGRPRSAASVSGQRSAGARTAGRPGAAADPPAERRPVAPRGLDTVCPAGPALGGWATLGGREQWVELAWGGRLRMRGRRPPLLALGVAESGREIPGEGGRVMEERKSAPGTASAKLQRGMVLGRRRENAQEFWGHKFQHFLCILAGAGGGLWGCVWEGCGQ